jgi:uncharacterized protein
MASAHMAIETPEFFVNSRGQRLFSVLHLPDAPATDFAVVYCAPLFEEKLWSHRIMVNFARYLATLGITVLRFDYFGDGESEGRFEEASVSTRVQDIVDAAQHCLKRSGVSRVHLLGLGYGATLAIAASDHDGVDRVMAWAPVFDGERYAGELLRAHLTSQMVVHRKIIHDREALIAQILSGQCVNLEGYEIGKPLYSEMVQLAPKRYLQNLLKQFAIVQIGPAERIDAQYAEFAASTRENLIFHRAREAKFWTQQKTVFAPCADLFAWTSEWFLAPVAA